jgi:hypothetical protein
LLVRKIDLCAMHDVCIHHEFVTRNAGDD